MMAWLAEHVERSEPREAESVSGTEATVEAEIRVVWDWTSDMLIVVVEIVNETVVSMMSHLAYRREDKGTSGRWCVGRIADGACR